MAEDLDIDPELDKLIIIERPPNPDVIDESYENLKKIYEKNVALGDENHTGLIQLGYEYLKKEKEKNNEPYPTFEEYEKEQNEEKEKLKKKWQLPP